VEGHRPVIDVMALCVEKANIRNAAASRWFEVAGVELPFIYEGGSLIVQLKCHECGL
jgi:hypothetical protein